MSLYALLGTQKDKIPSRKMVGNGVSPRRDADGGRSVELKAKMVSVLSQHERIENNLNSNYSSLAAKADVIRHLESEGDA